MSGLWTARLFSAFSLALFAAVSLAACGDGSNSESSGGGTGGTGAGGGTGGTGSGQHGEAYAAALCGNVFECCNTADLDELFNSGQSLSLSVVDYAGCRVLYRTFWDSTIETILATSGAAGRLAFDEAAFDACMKAIADRPCGQGSALPSLCADMFVPAVQKGGACTSALECKTGACNVPKGAAEGTCVDPTPPAALGESCSGNDDCDVNLYCGATTCAPVKADGQPCDGNRECQSGSCVGTQQGQGQCATICKGGGPGPGPVDSALEAAGGPLARAECGRLFECCDATERGALLFSGIDTELECTQFYGLFAGLALVQLHNSSAQGKLSIDGAALSACIDAYASESCQEFSKGSGDFDCADGITGLVENGKACAADAECASRYCNEPMQGQGICAALPGAGAPCNTDCAKGFYCDGATCVAQKALGDTCATDDQCGEGRCYLPPGGAQTCALACDGK